MSEEKRTLVKSKESGLTLTEILLVAVLLAAGIVLKSTIGSAFTVAGVKPNFIIAMYCLSILLIRPSFLNAAIIGLLSGAICQLFPGTPYLNFASELVGALVMYFLLCIPVNIGFGKLDLKPIVTTFLSTLASGFTFIAILNLAFLSGANVKTPVFAAFLVIIFGTATINSILVQALYLPLKAALVKDRK